MSFRDDGESAKARADALERELAERDAELAEREAELAEREAELAETRRALSAKGSERAGERGERARQEGERDRAARADAAEKLRALRRRGEERARAEAAQKERVATEASAERERERRARMLRSVSAVGEVEWGVATLAVGLPATIAAGLLAASRGPIAFLEVALAAALLVVVIVRGSLVVAQGALRGEVTWAGARPYTLRGYPAVLGFEPRSLVVDPVAEIHERMRGMFPSPDEAEDGVAAEEEDGGATGGGSDDHAFVWLRLEFRGDEPPGLEALLAAFDPSFVRRGPGRFRATSPVTVREGKHGPSSSTEDTNAELRRWVHRLDSEVLAPLHAAHGLSSAELGLSRAR